MSFLFGKKRTVQALAEVLEDGRAKMNKEMEKSKYNNYSGSEPELKIAVRVLPDDGAPFEATMKAGLTKAFLLLPGVKILVAYKEGKAQRVELVDELQAILDRNPQLVKDSE